MAYIPLIKNTYFREDITTRKLINFLKKANHLSFGEQCRSFEKKFSKFQKRKYTTFVNSGSSANLALIQSLLNLGILKKGDKVGFSAITWSTNVMPLIELGLEAIPVDIELDTLNISSQKLTFTLSSHNLKALFITNLLGFCDDIDKIASLCKRRKIILIEDNCESLGSVYKKKLLGNYGIASTFSFYVGHHMSTIEGGAICTDDKQLATMLDIVRAHGWDRNLKTTEQIKIRNKYKVNSTFYSRYTFYDLGYNFRPTEISGLIGNIQIDYLPMIIEKRNKNFIFLARKIYSRPDLYYPLRYEHIDYVSNFAVPLICRTKKIRDELVKKCNNKIEIRPIVGGDISKQPFFTKYMKKYKHHTVNATLAHEQGLYFGNNPELKRSELEFILKVFNI